MKENKITIDGKQYPVEFNMSTLIAFERTAESSFFGEKFDSLYARLILVFAAMFAADESITTDVLLKSKDFTGITQAFTTVMQMAKDFFKIPETSKEETAPDTNGEEKKNG